MLYDIRLLISYHYPSFVKDARHILRVEPREDRGQRVLSRRLAVEPSPGEMQGEDDFFGNRTAHLLIPRAHDALRVGLTTRVRVDRPTPNLVETPPPAVVRRLAGETRDSEGDSPIHFGGAGQLVAPSPAIAAWAAQTLDEASSIGLGLLALARRIRSEFRFQAGVSSVATRVEETFAMRRGVCQDFSHMMIAGLRGCGIPAAYASGFLRTEPPPGRPRLEGADAMHAWVEAWTGPDGGWIGFDPTNGCLAGDDHVLVALGRDYADVAPIDGALITAGPQKHRHTVDMVPVAEAVRDC
ncbi:transglutaminase family protein [Aureimonas flava]|uniref:Transglutaminase family protein n=1 Tax=Aureimonas flava TaxID=2320271 RepID=A0A3A1WL92_9HYPH|nr:transglutaminase family protein [Aureimonas flava]RIY00137.1 transglutaminase family protein [Aureimonas flava]